MLFEFSQIFSRGGTINLSQLLKLFAWYGVARLDFKWQIWLLFKYFFILTTNSIILLTVNQFNCYTKRLQLTICMNIFFKGTLCPDFSANFRVRLSYKKAAEIMVWICTEGR